MSGGIASKNLYELLGNDPDLDPERRQPSPPTKAVDKPAARTGKRNAGGEAAPHEARPVAARGGRQHFPGNEEALRDRNAGSNSNRGKTTEDGLRQDRHSNRLRGEQPRGGRGRGTRRDDRHSRTGISDHPKQVQQGWGGDDGNKELADERAGEAMAKQEETDTAAEAENAGNVENAEDGAQEEKLKSYDDYIAEISGRKAALATNVEVRKPNEGASKRFPEGKPIERSHEDEVFFVGDAGKKGRDRGKKEKNQLDLGDIYGRGDERGGFRGARGARGGGRGGRGPREASFRGDGRGRGGRGGRGGERGGAGAGARVNVNDTSAFPTLGA